MSSAKILKIDARHLDIGIIKKAAQAIKDGQLVVYPTETCYALGADASNPDSVSQVFSVKERLPDSPIPIIVDTMTTAEKFAFLNKQARKVAAKFWPGPLTIAVRKKEGIPDVLNPDRVAMRIPSHPVAFSLAKQASVPVTATSANRSGDPSPYSLEAVMNSIGSTADCMLDAGTLPLTPPSTIVDFVMKPSPQITREGAIPADMVLKTLGVNQSRWSKHKMYLSPK